MSHYGSLLSLDATATGTDTVQQEGLAKYGLRAINLNTPGAGVDDDEKVNAKQVRAILEAVAAMDKSTVLLFHALLKGMGMTEAAEYAGFIRQVAYVFAHRAVDACPALAALLPTRITKQMP